jgi:hypothetical protein
MLSFGQNQSKLVFKHFLAVTKVQVRVAMLDNYITVITVESNDITAQVSGEQKHHFHLWGLQKSLHN